MLTAVEQVHPRRPGRPRDASLDAAVLEATIELIGEHGVAGLSMDQVAARAGVGKATIYRRWENREALLLDAVKAGTTAPIEPPDTGTLRGDLETYTGRVVEWYRSSALSGVLPHLVAASVHDEELRASLDDYVRSRQEPLRTILRRAADRRELGAFADAHGVDALVSALVGPFTYRRLLTQEPIDAAFAGRIVDLVVTAVAGPAH